jgi:hypothetical protein
LKAIAIEPADINETESVSAARRPRRSAYRPSTQPPSGRIRKPIAKTTAVDSSCAVASCAGKKAPAK